MRSQIRKQYTIDRSKTILYANYFMWYNMHHALEKDYFIQIRNIIISSSLNNSTDKKATFKLQRKHNAFES